MMVEEIAELEDLVANFISKEEKLLKYNARRLTLPGEHYGSLMLDLNMTLKNEQTGEERDLTTIAKVIPRNVQIQEDFDTQLRSAFGNEIGFYREVVPALEQFLRQCGLKDDLNFIAHFYGARLDLSPHLNQDAVLILENLRSSGFLNVDKRDGFDFQTAKLITKTMATFHTLSLALKIKDKKSFDQKIMPYIYELTVDNLFKDFLIAQITNTLLEDKVTAKYANMANNVISRWPSTVVSEKWTTIIHNDLWSNNVMIKQNDKNVTTDVKILNFQTCEYKSALKDLVFFLFVSLSIDLLEKHLDELLDLYYKSFLDNLKRLKVCVSGFPRKEFNEQLKVDARNSEYYHLMLMLNAIYAEAPGDVAEFISGSNQKLPQIGLKHKEKLKYVTKKFYEKGWLE